MEQVSGGGDARAGGRRRRVDSAVGRSHRAARDVAERKDAHHGRTWALRAAGVRRVRILIARASAANSAKSAISATERIPAMPEFVLALALVLGLMALVWAPAPLG